MSVEQKLKDYEKNSYTTSKKHEQTCVGYGIFAAFAILVLVICGGALLGVAQDRKKINSNLQETICVVDFSMLQSNNVILAVHYQVMNQRINSTKIFNGLSKSPYVTSETFTCYYDKARVTNLQDLQDENAVFIPSMICFSLLAVPIIAIAVYYFVYWKKMIAEAAKSAETQKN